MTERHEWKVGSALMMYTESDGNWYNGRVKQIEGKGKKEWLTVKYAKGEKKFKRDSKDLKVDYFPNIEEDIYEEPKDDKKKKKKKAKKLKKDRSSKDVQRQKDAKLAKKVSQILLQADDEKDQVEEEEDVMD